MFKENKQEPIENNEHSSEEVVEEHVVEQGDQETLEEDGDASQKCLAEISLWKEQCRRISAEFENFKKRTERDQLVWADRAKESVLRDLLTLVDDFDRALKQNSGDVAGLEMMHQAFMKILEKNGVTLMESYETFDPEFHEAIMQVSSDKHESGQVVDVLSHGFMIKDRVFRPAKVSVAQ